MEDVLAAAAALRDALRAESARAGAVPEALRALDAARIFEGASARAGFNAQVAALQERLAAALARAAPGGQATLPRLRARAPGAADALGVLLADVRALAARIAERDRINLALAAGARACVEGYLAALSPRPAAYDRRGAPAAAARRA
ncbi:conserved hypothetical protein [Anaeromyxobacter dehalogenans 2CP-1]|uniref:FlgN family protein n=1 Tax=Anaeromyxobacter dehalogenans (strain ATCC BAA-258 / DSM 21875 / 2CP-1) TaxID=455488 RepID=B8JD96_ANAD2|nr:hypothetical protein [Anaeromyxobacter dehalogenans]ACL65945.1 conserved hypothetical protein [Anaeromyxobacter dehalogenans 2CP-1]